MKNTIYLLALFVVIFAFSSMYLYERNNALERTVLAGYSNEFNRTSEQLTELQHAVHQSLLFQDEVAQAEQLSTITRLSSSIKQSINNLPLDAQTTAEWNQYLARIGGAANEAKTSKDSRWIQSMQSAAKNLDEIVLSWNDTTMQLSTMQANLKSWQAIQSDGATNFNSHAKLLTTYRETDFPLTASESDDEKKRDLHDLMDQTITKKEALQLFKNYFPQIDEATLVVTRNKKDAAYPFYHIQFVQGARIGYADVTEKGGHIISFLLERPFNETAKTHEEIRQNAESFLKKVGYNDVQYIEARENHQFWHLVYSRVTEDGVIVYPDSIQIKVSKDSGEIVGLNAMEYIQKEKIQQHTIQPLDEKQFFQQDVTILEHKKVVTNNSRFESRICYEYIVQHTKNDHQIYRVVLDAETHAVLKIENMN